jgi:hypothetical protein
MIQVIFPSHVVYVEVINKNSQEIFLILSKNFNHGSKKVLMAFFISKGIAIQSNRPYLVINVVFRTSSIDILIYKNSNCKLSVGNHWDLPNVSKHHPQEALEKHPFKFVDLMGGNDHKTWGYHPSS